MNYFIDEININLPRILSVFDVDPTNKSYGLGDRFHWAWSLIDFGNGTFQGAAHGFARLWKAGLWPYKTSFSRKMTGFGSRIAAFNKPLASAAE